MGKYDTYYKGPILVGTGIDNIGAVDEGSVVISQQLNYSAFVGTVGVDAIFQVPSNIRLKEIYLDFAGANPTAGTYSVAIGPTNSVAGTPFILANNVGVNTAGPRTVAGYANNDPAAWALLINSGNNPYLRVSVGAASGGTAVTPVGVTKLSVLVSYLMLATA